MESVKFTFVEKSIVGQEGVARIKGFWGKTRKKEEEGKAEAGE